MIIPWNRLPRKMPHEVFFSLYPLERGVSSNKFAPKFAQLRFDPAGAFVPGGLSRDDQVALLPQVETLRGETLRPAASAEGAGLFDLPERMATDYRARRGKSELGRILVVAKRLRETVDRVVIVGSDDDCLAARASSRRAVIPITMSRGAAIGEGGRGFIFHRAGSTTMRCKACSICCRTAVEPRRSTIAGG